MFFKISPLDNLYFGKGSPFSAGVDTIGKSTFPPSPATFYGAFASYYLVLNGNTPKTIDIIKNTLQIKGIHYMLGSTVHSLAPLDLVKDKNQTKNEFIPLKLTRPFVYSNFPEDSMNLLYSQYEVENKLGLIDDITMKDYLNNRLDIIPYLDLLNYVQEEAKIGIKREQITRTVEEGYLYKVNYIRLAKDLENKLDFVIDLKFDNDALPFPEEGIIKLGGEGKAATFKKIEGKPSFLEYSNREIIKSLINKEKKFKIILNTPAVFKNGWKPDLKRFGLNAKLVTAILGKPLSIGGWDMEKMQAKPMYKLVPAGSVFYYELLEGEIDNFMENTFSISDFRENEGFGSYLLGVY